MGFRLGRSIQAPPGPSVNFSKSGIGYSLGAPGYPFTKSATGGQYHTTGLPGTGLYEALRQAERKYHEERPSCSTHTMA